MKKKLVLILILVMILAVSLACGGTGGGTVSGGSSTISPGMAATATSAAQEFHVQLTLIARMDATPVP